MNAAAFAKRLVAVALVVVLFVEVSPKKLPFVASRFVIVADADVRSVIVPLVIVVVARADVPVTARVPVVVLFTVVKLVMNAVTALKSDAKRVVDVLFVITPLTPEMFVA